jgi:hypothetical protein
MILQRLLADHTLENTLQSLCAGNADRLHRGHKRFSKKVRSRKTTSFSNGRRRLPLAFLKSVFLGLPALLAKKMKGRDWKGWTLLLFDGTTVRLSPLGDIGRVFSPHSNKKGTGYWCLMRVVVGFCLRSGLAVACAVGSQTQSEQALACALILSAQAKSLILGDRNFGIFRIMQTTRHAKAAAVVRLTRARAQRLVGKLSLLPGLDLKLQWRHSRHDQLQANCSTQPVEGRLIVCRIKNPEHKPFDLYLFTTLLDESLYSAKELVALYGFRWHVELNLRYLKSQMDLGYLNCKSAQMAEKEWYAGLIAYNLIRSMMFLAAVQHTLDPLCLSFSSSARHICQTLLSWAEGKKIDADSVLATLAATVLPKRKKPRPNEPRLVRFLSRRFGQLKGKRSDARQKLPKSAPKC